MGQYFKAVNIDKKEYVCPWCMHGGAKLWEWAANTQGAVFTLLLRKSDGSGGGDYYGYRTQNLVVDTDSPEGLHTSLLDAFHTAATIEGQPIQAPAETIVGRWAGDRVMLVGDYDSSKLWDDLPQFRNVTEELVDAWNSFIDLPDKKLDYSPCSGCRDPDKAK